MGKNNQNPPSWAFEGVWSPSLPSAASNYSQVSRKAAAAAPKSGRREETVRDDLRHVMLPWCLLSPEYPGLMYYIKMCVYLRVYPQTFILSYLLEHSELGQGAKE